MIKQKILSEERERWEKGMDILGLPVKTTIKEVVLATIHNNDSLPDAPSPNEAAIYELLDVSKVLGVARGANVWSSCKN